MALLALLWPGAAWAATRVTLRAEVHPQRVSVGDLLSLKVILSVSTTTRGGGFYGGTPYSNYRHPDLKDFEITRQWTNQSTQLNIIGGRASREAINTFHYILRPRRSGSLKIGAASVTVHGKQYRSNAISLSVGAGPAPPPPLLPGQSPRLSGDDEIFVQVVPDKLKAWVGEQVTVTWYLYARTRLTRQPTVKKTPATPDFFSEEIPFKRTQAVQTRIGEHIYQVLPIYRRALFALKSGRLKVGPLTAEVMTTGSSYYSLRPVVRASAPVHVDVQALPATNRPASFQPSNVGRFTVSAEADPVQIDARGATSLKLVVAGTGNLHGIKVERIKQLPGFKVRFAGQKTELKSAVQMSGKRIHEYVLIPTRVGTLAISPICFAHFNPAAGRYVTDACSKPISITVTGKLPAAGAGAAGGGQDNVLKRRIKPILQRGSLSSRSAWQLHRTRWLLWLLVFLPVVALGVLLVVRRVRAKLDEDTEARRRRLARGRARKRLRVAVGHLKAGDRVGFFSEIANVLQDHLSARLGTRVHGLTATDLRELLEQSGMADELRARLLRDLEICDFARFAPAAAEEEEMEEALERARDLIADIDRARIQEVAAPEQAEHAEAGA